ASFSEVLGNQSLLRGFPGAASDSVTLREGENLNLHCALSSGDNSTLQWVNPRGFTIFFNAQRVLRDPRYKLLHYSKDKLSIRLSNVTVQDTGTYSCFSYSSHFQSKSRNVQILAAPSQPVLEVSQDSGRGIKLSCHTQGCKPQPQISWLLDNGIELQGDTRHQLGPGGKKWSTSSTLRILSYSPKVTASCIIQHPALGGERLVASFPFQDLPSTAQGHPVQSLFLCEFITDIHPGEFSQSLVPAGCLTTQTSVPEPNPESKGMVKKERNLLLPILVAALILVLLIIVLLFMVKLKKAHGVWKRENDVSEQTLESYKSRSNEDSPGHEKNGQAANPKSNMQYVTEGHNPETPEKNPGDKNLAISEKTFECGRETDV
uniref:Cytotoxic and regulatory T cell molecule n=1 Tax=Cyanoderma ruficeps TaxID=181631 RepID=A0A8C3NWZ7_9PASS